MTDTLLRCLTTQFQTEAHRAEIVGVVNVEYEELHSLNSSPSIIRMIKSRNMRWVGHVARMGEKRNAYRILIAKPDGKRPLARPRHRWEDNIRTDLGG
jgi:hypothetical protein